MDLPGLFAKDGHGLGMHERHWTRYWLGLAVVAALTAVYAYERDLVGQYLNYQRSRSEFRDMQRHVEESRTKEELARRRVEMLRSDPVEIEAAVRRDKNLLRAGERVYRIETEPEQEMKGERSLLFPQDGGESFPRVQEDPAVRNDDDALNHRAGQNEASAMSGRD